MKRYKGLKSAIEKYNKWPGTARIYADLETGRVWTETFVLPEEGRYICLGESIVEVMNKEGLNTAEITTNESALLAAIGVEEEEREVRGKTRFK